LFGSTYALLSQEGSGIAKHIPRGVVPKPNSRGYGTTPRTTFGRAALLTQEDNALALRLFGAMPR